jgi:ribosomal protein L24E
VSSYSRHVDDELLAAARQAQDRLIDAERDADVARADFHRAVRRLHLHGASLRELAGALGLSHQRVHQIVESAGGSRRWLRQREPGHREPGQREPGHRDAPRSAPKVTCSFCGRDQAQGGRIIPGHNVRICAACVALAQDAIRSRPAPGGPFLPVIFMADDAEPECEPRVRLACSFCGKQVHQVAGLAVSSGASYVEPGRHSGAIICTECLDLCDEILAE